MKTSRQGLSIIAAASLAMILLQPTGCMSWQAQRGTPEEVLGRSPTTAIVVAADSQSWELRNPRIMGDSIVGTNVRAHSSGSAESSRVAIPTTDVRQIKIYRFNAGRTVALVAGIGLTAAFIVAMQELDDFGGSSSQTSCPTVYSWDGHHWRRDSGTFGGAIAHVLARTDVDNLDFASPEDGVLRLRVTNELDETDHIDAISVLAVDHDPGVSVAPDPRGTLHTIESPELPIAARDFAGRDVARRIRTADGWGWESAPDVRDTASEARDVAIR